MSETPLTFDHGGVRPGEAAASGLDDRMLKDSKGKMEKVTEIQRHRDSLLGGRPAKLRPSENHLYFDAVVRHGSIRRAADALHIASSALNRRILDLEHEVGTALFERLPRGMRLTTAGELLLGFVRQSLKDLRKVELEIEQLRGEVRGVVRIAVAESVTPTFLPGAIAAYQLSHAGVGFHVQVDGPGSLIEALTRDSVDLILTHEAPSMPGATVLAEARHQLCALFAPDHPLSKLPAVSLSDCVEYPLAIPDQSLAARTLLDTVAEEAALTLRPALESDSIETLKSFARLGRAVCISFRLGAEEESPGLSIAPLRDPPCSEASLYLAMRKGRVLPVAAATFAELLVANIRSAGFERTASVA